jgi:hypothetical protein
MAVTIPVVIVVSLAMAVVVVFVLAIVVPVIVPVLFPHFVATKVPFPAHMPSPIGSITPVRKGTPVAETGIEMVIHIAVEAFGAMKPWSSANEDSTRKPLRSVIAEGSAGIGRVIEVSVWTSRGHPYSDADVDLRRTLISTPRNANCGNSHRDTKLQSLHQSPQWIGEWI